MTLEDLRAARDAAHAELVAEVERTCPGEHDPVQHRDGKPPWCGFCGRGWDGRVWRGVSRG